MIDQDWMVEKLEISGTYHHSSNLSSLFEWAGPLIRSVNGLEIQSGEVVSSGGKVEFLSPSKVVDVQEELHEKSEHYTEYDDATMTLYAIRTTNETNKSYFIPSNSGFDLRTGFEEGVLVASGDDVYFRRLLFNTSPTGEYSNDTHTNVLHKLGDNVPPLVKTNDEVELGLEGDYTRLNKIGDLKGPV